MSFPRYPKYKESGIPWLGPIPAHWKVLPLKRRIAGVESGTSVNAADEPATEGAPGVLKTSCVYTGKFDPSQNKLVTPEDRERVACPLRPGALIVSRMNTPELVGAAGLVDIAPPNIYLPDRLWQITFREMHTPFIYYWTRTSSYRTQVEAACTGTSSSMKNLSQEDFGQFWLPVPGDDEQRGIVAFLERETAKIDALTAEQERLTELLKEKRQAVISNAVTKGLSLAAPMRASGIEWLGDIPAHWEVRRVKTLSTFTTSGPRGWSERLGEDGALFVQSGNLDDRMNLQLGDAKRVVPDSDAEAARTELREGDVLVCITGAKTGNVAVCQGLQERAFINQHLCLVRPSEGVVPRFLAIALKGRTGATYFDLSQYGLKQGLSLEDVREAPVALPPVGEQAEIVERIDFETSKLDVLIEAVERGMVLLAERRVALISAAVTGQIDVREATARSAA